MSTATNYEIKSPSFEFSQRIGEQIGRNLQGHELIILISDLGGGKTTLTKGIVAGAGSKDLVSSPSFTLSNVYSAGDFQIIHYDFYRINNPGVLLEGIIEDINDERKVVIVEWPDIVLDKLINISKLMINIKSLSENDRIINLIADREVEYTLKGVNELSLHK